YQLYIINITNFHIDIWQIFSRLYLRKRFSTSLTESTMLYGTLALVGSFVLQKMSYILFSIPYIQLKIFQKIVELFGSMEWGYIDVKTAWLGWLIGIIILFFCVYFYPVDEENYYVKRLKDL
ncbi:MAG: hypothetical protein WCX94_02980, partial [Candidatus Dojkabacteria bacterium]